MCFTPNNHAQILHIRSPVSRPRRTGQWARVRFSTQNFAKLLGVNVPGGSNILPTFLTTWIIVQYIPTFVTEPPLTPPPRPYPGSIVDLVDSMEPAISPTRPPAFIASPTASTRTAQPFPSLELTGTDGPSKTGRKRKLSGNAVAGSSSQVPSEKRRRRRASDGSSDSEVIILSDNDAPEVIVISD